MIPLPRRARTDTWHLYILSEANIANLLWNVWRGRPVVVLTVVPLVSLLTPILLKLVSWLRRRGRIVDAFVEFPELHLLRDYRYTAYTRIYIVVEPWMSKYFQFDKRAQTLGEYAQAYRHVTFGYVDSLSASVMIIEILSKSLSHAVVHGGGAVLTGIYKSWVGADMPFKLGVSIPGRSIVNFISLLGAGCFGLMMVVARFRPWLDSPRACLLGATYISEPRHYPMLGEIVDDDRQVMSIFLTRADKRNHAGDEDGFAGCSVYDGRFDLATAIGTIAQIIRDMNCLYDVATAVPPRHFRGMLRLLLRRILYRGLFRRYRFSYVFGRDDYNAEHIVRTMELRRIGGTSMGINHGLPTTSPIEPGWRYLDFDIYYVFGRQLYERYFQGLIPKTMSIRPVGTFGVNRAQLAEIDKPRSPDIVYFLNPGPYEDLQSREVAALATLFPERRIWVKLKSSRKKQGYCEATLELFRLKSANVVETEENSYKLLLRHRYAICCLSTIAAEAVQLGAATFVLDVQPEHMPNLYRDYDGLCLSSGKAIADRIRAIESGIEKFERGKFSELIALDVNIFDAIRSDMGLPMKVMPNRA